MMAVAAEAVGTGDTTLELELQIDSFLFVHNKKHPR